MLDHVRRPAPAIHTGVVAQMAQVQPSVRGAVPVDRSAPQPQGPVRIVPARRPSHLGDAGFARLLGVEALVVVVLAVVGVARWVLIAGGVVLVLGLAVLLIRVRGRWWTDLLALRWHYYRRKRRHGPSGSGRPGVAAVTAGAPTQRDPSLVALRSLVPDLTVATYHDKRDDSIGVLRDEAGWFVITQLIPAGQYDVQPPLASLAQTLRQARQPGVTLQVVVHTVATPTVEIDPRNLCVSSYQELLGVSGPIPADRTVWVVVRVNADALGVAAPEFDGADGADLGAWATSIVADLAQRIPRSLRGEPVQCRILTARDAVEALVRSLDLEQPATAGDATGEAWDHWRSERLLHASFWMRGWPEPPHVAELLGGFATVPAAQTSVGLTLRPRGTETDLHCLVRVASQPNVLPQTCAALHQVANRFGAALLRLNGEQATAAYATAPSGGGLT